MRKSIACFMAGLLVLQSLSSFAAEVKNDDNSLEVSMENQLLEGEEQLLSEALEGLSLNYETEINTDDLLASGGLTKDSISGLVEANTKGTVSSQDYAFKMNFPRSLDTYYKLKIGDKYFNRQHETKPYRMLINGDRVELGDENLGLEDAELMPIEISDGFNVDVIADGKITDRDPITNPTKHASFSTNNCLEDTSKTSLRTVFVSSSFKGEHNLNYGFLDFRADGDVRKNQVLPSDGSFFARHNDGRVIAYQFQQYDMNNAIKISPDDPAQNHATITLGEPKAYSELSLLTTGTGIDVMLDITYSDGTVLHNIPFRFEGMSNPPLM